MKRRRTSGASLIKKTRTMYNTTQRREISARIADPADIPQYRQLLKLAGNPFARYIDSDAKRLAVFLVSALLKVMSEEDILRAVQKPAAAPERATAAAPAKARATAARESAEQATVAVKKNARKSRNTRRSTGTIWTILSSALLTAYSRMRSIWAAGCTIMRNAWAKLKRPRISSPSS